MCRLFRDDDLQGFACNIKFHRGFADILAVSINIHWNFGLNAYVIGLPILDVFRHEMPAQVSSWEEAKQFELVHRAHYAKVQLAIIEFRLGSDLDAASVTWGIGD